METETTQEAVLAIEPLGERVAPMRAAEIIARRDVIRDAIKAVMKKGVHYGDVPGGGGKPTLFKAGSEVILSTFRISTDPVVEDLSTEDEIRYRVKMRGLAVTGEYLGAGLGEASSNEEKYRWRRVVCKEEWEDTPADRRRVKWYRRKNDVYSIQQVRMNPADIANTVLKMAKKRAQIDMTLTVTACSDEFSQDIEDLPKEYLSGGGGDGGQDAGGAPPASAEPRKDFDGASGQPIGGREPGDEPPEQGAGPGNGNAQMISDKQARRFWAIAKEAGLTTQEIVSFLRLKEIPNEDHRKIPSGRYDALVAELQAMAKIVREGVTKP